MLCPICHKLEGEWQCQVCRRIVCVNDARPTNSGVYCVEHAPASAKQISQQAGKEESSSLRAVKGAFITIFFLTLGLGGISFISQYFIEQFAKQVGGTGLSQIAPTLQSLQSVGSLIFYFMVFLTAVLGFSWLALGRQARE